VRKKLKKVTFGATSSDSLEAGWRKGSLNADEGRAVYSKQKRPPPKEGRGLELDTEFKVNSRGLKSRGEKRRQLVGRKGLITERERAPERSSGQKYDC